MYLKKTTGLILAGSIALTSMVSAPAYADKEFNRIAAIIVGAAILNEVAKKNRSDNSQVSRRTYEDPYDNYTSSHDRRRDGYHRHDGGVIHRHANNGHKHKVKRHPKTGERWAPKIVLPKQCKRQVLYQGDANRAFSVRCLKKRGYKISKRGHITHPNYDGRKRDVRLVR